MTKLYAKDELIKEIKDISNAGWHKSVKKTVNVRNDGAVGNTLFDSLVELKNRGK